MVEQWNAQQVRNVLAELTRGTLVALCGDARYDSNMHPGFMRTMRSMLTSGLVEMLVQEDDGDRRMFLTTINSNVENEKLLWCQDHRDELKEFCTSQMDAMGSASFDVSAGLSFQFKALNSELVINDVFIRVFLQCDTPEVPDPEKFCKMLLVWLKVNAPRTTTGRRQEHVEQALRAAALLLREYPKLSTHVGRLEVIPIVFDVLAMRESLPTTTSCLKVGSPISSPLSDRLEPVLGIVRKTSKQCK